MTLGLEPFFADDLEDLPEGWVEASLAELAVDAIGGEWGLPDAEPVQPGHLRVRILRGTEFRDWEREKGATAAVRQVKEASVARRQLAPGDLVIEVSGGGVGQPVGRSVRIDGEAVRQAGAPLLCSNFCRRVRLHPEVSSAYVQLGLTHLYLTGALDEFQTQTTNLRNLSFQAFLSGVSLPLPPPAEQRRIAEHASLLLARVRRARERLAGLPALLKRLRRSVLDAATLGGLSADLRPAGAPPSPAPEALELPPPLELPALPAGWSWAALRSVVRRAQLGTSLKADADPGDGVPVLRMGNIKDGRIDLADLKAIARRPEELSGFRLERGDLLFNRTNSPELVGKAAVYEADDAPGGLVFASYLIRVACDPETVDSRFLAFWINSSWGRWWARTVRTDCVSQSNINTAKLLALPVPLPPLAEQRQIVGRAERLLAVADRVEAKAAKAARRSEEMTKAILARALSGELVESEAELAARTGAGYESAGHWLARTADERRLARAAARPAPRRPPRTLAPSQRYPRAGSERGNLEAYSQEWILAVFRQVCWGAPPMSREELLHRVADRLGIPWGRATRSRLAGHLEVASRRQIVGCEGERFSGATPTFGRYEFDFLHQTLRAVMAPDTGCERGELVRRIAAHLGYSQVTAAMRQRMEGFFHWALRHGLLVERRDGLWRR